MTESTVEEIVATLDNRQHPHKHLTESESRIVVASWRERGEALSLKERELDTLSASHKDLAHRLARMGEALKPFARMADAVDAWRKETREFMGQFDADDLRRARAALVAAGEK